MSTTIPKRSFEQMRMAHAMGLHNARALCTAVIEGWAKLPQDERRLLQMKATDLNSAITTLANLQFFLEDDNGLSKLRLADFDKPT